MDKYVAYVGTYTNGNSIGIHIYDVDVENGELAFNSVVPVNNSSHLTLSKNKKYLYSIADEGVEVFKIQPNGGLSAINKVDIDGMRGCFLSTDYAGKYLFVGGYHDGKVTLVNIHRDGKLGAVADGVFHKGTGTAAERNFRPHVTCVRSTPDDRYICAVDTGIDQVKLYELDKKKKLHLVDILRCKRDSGPRRIRFSADGRFAYVLFQLTNEIGVYAFDVSDIRRPKFELLQSVSTLSDKLDPLHDAAFSLRFSPDERYLACSTAGDNTVGVFKIDKRTGLLERQFILPVSGRFPKDLTFFPDGKHIAVVNNESESITTFAIDYKKKVMLQKGKPMFLPEPNCILMVKLDA